MGLNITLWIVQGLLAAVFLGAGAMKLSKSHEALKADSKMSWANDFSGRAVKLIGLAEVAGALGLILPGLTGIAPLLTPAAAAGLALLMFGAAATHLRRSEGSMVVPPLIFAMLAAFVAYGRFVVAPF